MTVTTIRCIYCKEEKPRPSKGEHIILDGLGGRATIPDVCSLCNSLLGREVDQEFLRNTHIALRRFFDPGITTGEAGAPQFIATEFGFLDIRLLNTQHADLLPQAMLEGDCVRVVAAEPDQQLANRVIESITNGSTKVHRSIKDISTHEPTRLVINRTPNRSHLLRARTEAQAQRLMDALSMLQLPGTFGSWELQTEVGLRMSTDLNVPGRCAAKMAFNMASYVLGPQVMLRGEFDAVREYIRGRDVIAKLVTLPNGERGLQIDTRFVEPWLVEREGRSTGPEHHHSIVLGERNGSLFAIVSLFGQDEQFRVRLGPMVQVNRERIPIAFARLDRWDAWMMVDQPDLQWKHGESPRWPLKADASATY